MSWKMWLVQVVLVTLLSVAVTALDNRLRSQGLFGWSYGCEWLIVIMGFYSMYLGCILYTAIIVRGWHLAALGIGKLGSRV
jgi:hypothetical protein